MSFQMPGPVTLTRRGLEGTPIPDKDDKDDENDDDTGDDEGDKDDRVDDDAKDSLDVLGAEVGEVKGATDTPLNEEAGEVGSIDSPGWGTAAQGLPAPSATRRGKGKGMAAISVPSP